MTEGVAEMVMRILLMILKVEHETILYNIWKNNGERMNGEIFSFKSSQWINKETFPNLNSNSSNRKYGLKPTYF